MQGIKAFVGHSFSDADKGVVRVFTDHFENLEKAHAGGFTWDHAEEAEAMPLSDKVLAKIQGKNVFIGICTRKERAVDPGNLKKAWWGNDVRATEADFVWKTSDWIIQEIGLAVGRDMSVIIFLEEGVRAPGGLYGNTEYISFSRNHPEQSFDKFLQMLVALSPKEATASIEETKTAAPEEKKGAGGEERDFDPKNDWGEHEYDDAAFFAIFKDKDDALAKIDDAFKRSIHAQGSSGVIWDAKNEYLRLVFGKKANFVKLKKLAEEHPDIPEVLSYVAFGHEKFEEFTKAAETYEQAAAVARDDVIRARYLGDAAIQYSKAESREKSAKLLTAVKELAAKNADVKVGLVSTLKMIAQQEKDEDMQLALLEYEVGSDPANTEIRFALAYKYSESKIGDMALHHYLKIPAPQRDATTWNNIGVSYGEFHLPVKGVRAFKRSAGAGETLAMSNLGNKMLNAGFFDEAKAECGRALVIPDYHKNVAVLLSRLNEIPDEEDKKLEEVLQKVKLKAEFLRAAGCKAIVALPSSVAPKWVAPEGDLEARLAGDALKIFGSYERPVNSLGGLLSGSMGLSTASARHSIEFVGRMRGCVFFGTVSRTGSSTLTTSLLDGVGASVLMYLNDAPD